MITPLKYFFSLSSSSVPVASEAHLMYALVEISGGGESINSASNLGFVIDISESMRIRLVSESQFAELVKKGHAQEVMTDGIPAFQISSIPVEMIASLSRRIDFVANALNIASETLRDKDYFSLIAFAGEARCLIGQSLGIERARLRETAQSLETLNLGDATNMDAGMELAIEEILRDPGRDHASRMILITDGHTRAVEQCYIWAKRAREAGIKISTLGIGSEFNEDLLIPLADLTGGNAYYIETPEKISEAFVQELGSAQNIRYRNMELKLQMTAGCKLQRIYRVLPEIGEFDYSMIKNENYSLQLGDYNPYSDLAFLLELVVSKGAPESQRLAQSLLVWDNVQTGKRESIRKEITIEGKKSGPSNGDTRIMAIVERVSAYELGLEALKKAQGAATGMDLVEKGAATLRLRQAATRLLDMGESSLANQMLQQADLLEKNGTLNADAAKKLRYETRRLSKNL
jgi:Ca-activated chloride channel family protein